MLKTILSNTRNQFNRISRVLVLLLAALFSLSLLHNISDILSADQKIAQASSRLDKLKQENERLEAEVKKGESPEFKEKQARDKLGLAREGEIVLVLPPPETLKIISPLTEEEEELTLPEPNWKKWRKLFF